MENEKKISIILLIHCFIFNINHFISPLWFHKYKKIGLLTIFNRNRSSIHSMFFQFLCNLIKQPPDDLVQVPDSLDVQADVLAVLLQHLPQVHGQRLEHHAQVVLVEEIPRKIKQIPTVEIRRISTENEKLCRKEIIGLDFDITFLSNSLPPLI